MEKKKKKKNKKNKKQKIKMLDKLWSSCSQNKEQF